MSRFRHNASLQLALAPQHWALSQQQPDMPDAVPLAEGALAAHWHADLTAIDTALAAPAAALQKHNGEVHVTLDDVLIRSFLVVPPSNASRLNDLMLCAQMRFESLYDEPATTWEVHGDWHTDRTFVACAIRQDLATALRGLSRSPSHRVVSMLPAWLKTWNACAANASPGWWAIGNTQSLVLLLLDERGPLDLRNLSFGSPPQEITLNTAIAQEANRLRVLHETQHTQLTSSTLRWLGTAAWVPRPGVPA